MNIAIDSRAAVWYRGTGMGTYTYQLIRNLYLIDRVNNYHFFLPEVSGLGANLNLNQEKQNHLKKQNWDLLNGGVFQSLAQTKTKFWEAVKAEPLDISSCSFKPDILHIPHNGIGCHWLTDSSLKPPCTMVVTIHDLIPLLYPETVGSYYLAEFLQTMPQILAASNKIIAVSTSTKNDLITMLDIEPTKIEVIYEAPEPIYQPQNPKQAQAKIKEKYGIKLPFILYLGGFSPRKNVVGLLKAFKEIYADLPEKFQLVIVGRPSPGLPQIQRWVEKLNLNEQVVFTGFAPMQDLPLFYNACRVFAYPSFCEGFGLPPLEAMACGTPTLVGNVSALPEVVANGALQVDPFDHLEIAKGLFQLCTNQSLRLEISKLAIKRAAGFSWTKAAAQTLRVYQSLV